MRWRNRTLLASCLAIASLGGIPLVTVSSAAGATPADVAGAPVAFGGAPTLVAAPAATAAPVVGMTPSPSGKGYWIVAGDGGVFAGGDAKYYGSMGGKPLKQPVVGIAGTPDGQGYWEVASDGGIFTFGDAKFFGSTGAMRLDQPVVAMAATPDGKGYWLVAADGGIFTFGDATFHGSMGARPLDAPVVGVAPTSNGAGYYEVASDGGIFTFGNAHFMGSAAGLSKALIVGMALTGGNAGYWMVSANGGVFTYGNAKFSGSMGGATLANPIVGMASSAAGGYWLLPSSAPRWPWGLSPLSYGASGPSVQAVQEQLGKLSYWIDGPNGTFDDSTQQAVWALEKAAGIGRTGVMDVPTFSALVQGVVPHPRSTSGYWVEINLTTDLLMFVNNGQLLYTLNTSTGGGYVYDGNQLAITPQGQFSIFRSVDGLVVDSLGALWRPRYFTGGYAIHGDSSVPPDPVSHGCARVSNEAIDWIWANNLAPIGTSVWVYS